MADDVRQQPGSSQGEEAEEGEPQKGYQEILAAEIQTGLTELERPSRGLFLSGLSLTTVGNVAGSVVFVALIKYGHAKFSGASQ